MKIKKHSCRSKFIKNNKNKKNKHLPGIQRPDKRQDT